VSDGHGGSGVAVVDLVDVPEAAEIVTARWEMLASSLRHVVLNVVVGGVPRTRDRGMPMTEIGFARFPRVLVVELSRSGRSGG
jgi:hypothetical protein